MNTFYVYQLRVEDEPLPFYVGKGKDGRAYEHLKDGDDINPFKKRKIRKAQRQNKQILVEFIKTDLIEDDAFLWEVFYIAEFGRRDLGLGPLTNLTDGGEGMSGFKFSDESLQRLKTRWDRFEHPKGMLGKKHSPEVVAGIKARLAENHPKGMLGKKHSEEAKARWSEQRRGKPSGIVFTEETKAKISKARKGKVSCFDKETLQNIQLPREEFERLKGVRYIGVNSKEAKSLRSGLTENLTQLDGGVLNLFDSFQ